MGFIIDISPYRWESILDCMASSIRWIPIVRMDHFSPLSDESIMRREEEFWMLQRPVAPRRPQPEDPTDAPILATFSDGLPRGLFRVPPSFFRIYLKNFHPLSFPLQARRITIALRGGNQSMTTLSRCVTWRRIDAPGAELPTPGELVWWARGVLSGRGAQRVKDLDWVPAIWLEWAPGEPPAFKLASIKTAQGVELCHISRIHRGDEPPTRRRP